MYSSENSNTRPNIRESQSETRVLEYPLSAPFRRTKGCLRVLRAEDGPLFVQVAPAPQGEAAQLSRLTAQLLPEKPSPHTQV